VAVMLALLIRRNGESEIVDLSETVDFLLEAFDLLEAEFLDHVTFKERELDGWVNDTGGAENPVATSLVGAVGYAGMIWGPLLLTGGTDEWGNTKSLVAAPGLKIWAERIKEKIG
jgi:hypothetical protein